jgi:3',5'-cyclic AMP phosphodiesterase CpdA
MSYAEEDYNYLDIELSRATDRIEALTAENERLRAALTTAKNALNLLSHGEGDDYRMEWLEAVLAETRAALGDTQ